MPRNRRPRDSDEKRGEIVTAARALFAARGYEAVSMQRIAADSGVAANTIYWYFPGKDDLFIAVLDQVLAEASTRALSEGQKPLADQLLDIVSELDQVNRLVASVHARVAYSDRVREWHDGFHAGSEALLRARLAELGVPEERLDPVVRIGVFTIEGLLTHTPDAEQRRGVVAAYVQSAESLAGVRRSS
ncbi:TetR/AcrR family transcriptional regulator [Actinokineospora pegani]|uniref:TetR/AcrR family transcriptional regulator n=1 Tax=Actinokineospora pegani TaxID=2654637 RepID=UPI0012E9E1D0|nr:TetR/AcrR family transcriptional regulator [Actinokineospora pegani]